MTKVTILGALLALSAYAPRSVVAQDRPGETGGMTTFQDDTPLASNAELARRLLTPLTSAQLPMRLKAMGKGLREQPVDLAQEHFYLRVPATKPATGYGLIVFVPPWEDAHLPGDWGPVLDRLGLIFISAARSGNDDNPIARREPLAILAAHHAMTHYPVDPSRVIIAGFSGGSRVALRLALAYPDLFPR
ncbi:MAG: hypothetical protein M3R41_02040, partial [Pseudomonadota bacterium]|nr:hypothetical protein [Pseudomonadota bacterium]